MSKVVSVARAGQGEVNGLYFQKSPDIIPTGFVRTCNEMNWPSESMWKRLSDPSRPWFLSQENDSYIYYNRGDGNWWIDLPSGAGAYIVESSDEDPPYGGWVALPGNKPPLPTVEVRESANKEL